ncbi:hypothetical protein BD779DRAFT_1130654 [Infundibulicybe gibba]|nr:hypothetical protein BD779DRAFT_1130654 [Infundibulicybe gibba]
MSGPVLQMLGARYNIEPFFFSSSLGWIPSRYQEDVQAGIGDHITITMTFLRSTRGGKKPRGNFTRGNASASSSTVNESSAGLNEQMIDTRAPLALRSGTDSKRLLVLDLLSVHLIRNVDGNTIISYHPNYKNGRTTTASYLRDRIQFAGQSVYWQNIFKNSPDPTFVLLCYVWHAMYAWDEALEHLYSHICLLVSYASYYISSSDRTSNFRKHGS